jgi:hypothetical protein
MERFERLKFQLDEIKKNGRAEMEALKNTLEENFKKDKQDLDAKA